VNGNGAETWERETKGREGEAAGSESRGTDHLEVGSRSEIFVRPIEPISDKIRIVRSQKSG